MSFTNFTNRLQSHHEYEHLLETAFEACYGFGVLFVPCKYFNFDFDFMKSGTSIYADEILGELGERLTQAFWVISDTIEQFKWYRFPLNIKRLLPMIINEVHVPVVLNCFGSTACVRGSFKNVSRIERNINHKIDLKWLNLCFSTGRQQRILVFYDTASIFQIKQIIRRPI